MIKGERGSIEHQKDFYKSELLRMGYFKTPDKKQLYELSLAELESIYLSEKARLKDESQTKTTIT